MCDFCGPNSTHHTQHCFKLQALNAKVDRIKHEKQIAGNSTNRRQFNKSQAIQVKAKTSNFLVASNLATRPMQAKEHAAATKVKEH